LVRNRGKWSGTGAIGQEQEDLHGQNKDNRSSIWPGTEDDLVGIRRILSGRGEEEVRGEHQFMARKRRTWSITAGFARNRRIWSGGTPVYGQEKEELVNNSRICQEQEDLVRGNTSLWPGKGGTGQ
jgi:hypothetical protein